MMCCLLVYYRFVSYGTCTAILLLSSGVIE